MWERLEVRYTPKHGSWLNMAETELSVLSGQCLDRRIDEVAVLRSEVGSWEDHRNQTEAKVRWRFTTEDARIKLEKLYPVLEYPDPHGLPLPTNLSKIERQPSYTFEYVTSSLQEQLIVFRGTRH